MIPFSPPRMDDKIIKEVIDTLKSGWITTGPKTKLFEKKLTQYAGHKSTLCVSSGSAGLELMLKWFGVKNGDEVIVPAYTYSATANVIIHCGARPVFVDINQDDFNISVEAVKNAITGKTKVIMPVDIGGYPCDYDRINSLVNREEIRELFNPDNKNQEILGRIMVLSDAAHSIGAEYSGKKAGNLTDITVFSFHAVKNITTAEGGAVCLNLPAPFNNKEIYRELNIKSLHGQSKDALAKFQIGNWRYDVVEAGYKYNMTDIAAAMGLVELERYEDDMLPKRKEIFDMYSNVFSKKSWAQTPVYEKASAKSSYHAYLLRIKNITEKQRDRIIKEIFNKKIAVNVHFVPLPMMSYYADLGYNMDDYPVSYQSYSREISLPVYYTLTNDQVSYICRSVTEAVEKIICIKQC